MLGAVSPFAPVTKVRTSTQNPGLQSLESFSPHKPLYHRRWPHASYSSEPQTRHSPVKDILPDSNITESQIKS